MLGTDNPCVSLDQALGVRAHTGERVPPAGDLHGSQQPLPLLQVISTAEQPSVLQSPAPSNTEHKASRDHAVTSDVDTATTGVSRRCTSAALTMSSCIGEAQKRASDLLVSTLSTAVGYLARPLSTIFMLSQRNALNLDSLIARGNSTVVVLGQHYSVDLAEERRAFWADFCSQIVFTYRKDFWPITTPRETHLFASGIRKSLDPNVVGSPDNNQNSTSSALSTQLDRDSNQARVTWGKEHRLCNVSSVTQERHNFPVSPTPPVDGVTRCPAASHTAAVRVSQELPFLRRTLCEDPQGRIVSDVGWGCMIRVTQMAVCRSLVTRRLGRTWRRVSLRRPLCNDFGGIKCTISGSHDDVTSNDVQDKVEHSIHRHGNSEGSLYNLNSAPSKRPVEGCVQERYVVDGCDRKTNDCLAETSDPPYHTFDSGNSTEKLARIIQYFADTPTAPLSIHSFAEYAALSFGSAVGQWLGPTTCAQTAACLMRRFSNEFLDVIPVVFPDGLIIHSTIRDVWKANSRGVKREQACRIEDVTLVKQTVSQCKAASVTDLERQSTDADGGVHENVGVDNSVSNISMSATSGDSSLYRTEVAVLMIVCMRLGSQCFNAEKYAAPLSRCFELAQFQGIAGGGSTTSAFFFIGECADGLLFLDPHVAVLPPLLYAAEATQNSAPLENVDTLKHTAPSDNFNIKEIVDKTGDTEGFSLRRRLSLEGTVCGINKEHTESGAQTAERDLAFLERTESSLFTLCPEEDQRCRPYGSGLSSSCPAVVHWKSLNPSMALYFLCVTPEEYDELILCLNRIAEEAGTPELFETMDVPVTFNPRDSQEIEEDPVIMERSLSSSSFGSDPINNNDIHPSVDKRRVAFADDNDSTHPPYGANTRVGPLDNRAAAEKQSTMPCCLDSTAGC